MQSETIQVFDGLGFVGVVTRASNGLWFAELPNGMGEHFLTRERAVSELLTSVAVLTGMNGIAFIADFMYQ